MFAKCVSHSLNTCNKIGCNNENMDETCLYPGLVEQVISFLVCFGLGF